MTTTVQVYNWGASLSQGAPGLVWGKESKLETRMNRQSHVAKVDCQDGHTERPGGLPQLSSLAECHREKPAQQRSGLESTGLQSPEWETTVRSQQPTQIQKDSAGGEGQGLHPGLSHSKLRSWPFYLLPLQTDI